MGKEVSVKEIKKNIIISVTAQVISLIVSFIMNLILPKFISEYQYAYWQMYLLYVGYVGVLHFGLLDGLVLRYSQYDYDELDKTRIRSQFKCLLAITSVLAPIGIVIACFFSNADMRIVFVYVAIGIISRNLFTYTSYLFQITNNISKYAQMIISFRIFYGVVVSALLIIGVKDFYWYCLADLCSDMFAVLVSSFNNKGLYFGKSLNIKESIIELKNNISAGAMLMIANLSSFLLTGSARLIIQWYWDELTFGKVSLSFSVTNLFLTFISAISVVLFPSLKRANPEKLPHLYKQIRDSISPLLVFILIFYYPGCVILRYWLPAYNESLIYLGVILPIIIYTTKVSLLTNNYLKAYREEKKLLRINLLSVLIAIVLFVLCAWALNNMMLLILCFVGVVILRTVLSELAVMKIIGQTEYADFFIEIAMTIIFIVSAIAFKPVVGFIVYSVSLLIYMMIYRNSVRSLLVSVFNKIKK